jgi:hypothetical protein
MKRVYALGWSARTLFAVALCLVRSLTAQTLPPLPTPVTNAAVASGVIDTMQWAFVMLGVDSTKRWSGITRRAVAWSSASNRWTVLPDVPGAVGRLAASAQLVRGKVYLIGGYTVDSAGTEHSVPDVNIYSPRTGSWTRGADIPVSIDDAVVGVYRDSLLYVVSGWHETDNVQSVQIYDVLQNTWHAGTPIPGPGVFGHTGALSGNTIVYIDGAARQSGAVKYGLVNQVWIGAINPAVPTLITWRRGPAHPGPPLYRAAATAIGPRVIITGGTNNPYNYNGIGYDARPAVPSARTFAYDVRRARWVGLPPLDVPTMDHRGLVRLNDALWTVGGMESAQRVSARAVKVMSYSTRRNATARVVGRRRYPGHDRE